VPSNYQVPLNLFDIYTMDPEALTSTGVVSVVITPSRFVEAFATTRPGAPFSIPGAGKSSANSHQKFAA